MNLTYSFFILNRLEDSTLSATDQVKALEKEVSDSMKFASRFEPENILLS